MIFRALTFFLEWLIRFILPFLLCLRILITLIVCLMISPALFLLLTNIFSLIDCNFVNLMILMRYKLLCGNIFGVIKWTFDFRTTCNIRRIIRVHSLLGGPVSIGIGMTRRWLIFLAYILFSLFLIDLCLNIGRFLARRNAQMDVSLVKDRDNILLDEFTKG
jgi:hypothetical protein